MEGLRRLQTDWRDAGAGLGLPVRSRAWMATFEELVTRHRDPKRHYHRAEHVAAVLRSIVELTGDMDPILVTVAFFHDAIYEPKRDDNEVRSAELAAETMTRSGCSAQQVEIVADIICATARHLIPDGIANPELCATFLDADLSILGAFPKSYDAYATAIRLEYQHLDDETFRSGRADVLQSFLDRDQLYFTEAGQAAWESSARHNIRRELAKLTS